ncbi:MAG TPA: dihydrolipoamide acetyltransferase family protein [Hyphomicrobiaceae bacterium]|nr:dihydrolipoamide acetyltransferase family protein [Hyphomicrobiaceae bacterium]
MPQLGETVAEGKITRWFKAVGDAVKAGDNLFEIETDKTSMEVPAIAAGVLAEIRVPAGEVAPVGAVVAVLSDGAAAVSSAAAGRAASATAHVSEPAAAQVSRGRARTVALDPFFEVRTASGSYGPARLASGIVLTPLARRLAKERGVDLHTVRGSGPYGRIVARDVEAAAGAQLSAAPVGVSPAGPTAERVKALYEPSSYEEVPLDNMRRTIAARLTEAVQSIPHFCLASDVDVDELLKLREEANATAPKDKAGNPTFRLTLNDLIVKAWAAALQRVPAANAVWAGDRILRLRSSDIGVAVAVEGGLYTPIIRNAERKSPSMISAEVKELAARAQARRLKPQDYQGGSSAISNLGMYGIRAFSAIINPPHATILAVGAVRRQPVETADGGVRFISQMTVTLSCDHRVVDGALGAELLGTFKGFVEKPVTALA